MINALTRSIAQTSAHLNLNPLDHTAAAPLSPPLMPHARTFCRYPYIFAAKRPPVRLNPSPRRA
jgi:hypothetical protein